MILPVEIVFHPSWWHRHAGICFDRDFFYDPRRRVADERQMEQVLYDRFGQWGLGADRDKDLPQIGAVHNAAGYLLSEMLGCEIVYADDAAPQVLCAHRDDFELPDAFQSEAFHRLETLFDALQSKYGYLCGDINWSGVLNLAMDLKGENVLLDMMLNPEECRAYFDGIASVVERFFSYIQQRTGSNSVSVNRLVRHLPQPVFLHSECSHTMISEDDYRAFLMPYDLRWSRQYRPFGIHYCGKDPHRYAQAFAELPHLDFLDLGWGGDVAALRRALPDTFLNIRLSPVELNSYTDAQLESIVVDLVRQSAGQPGPGNKACLTGVCCINMDADVDDARIHTLLRTVESLRREYC